jgi:hypothetical protein
MYDAKIIYIFHAEVSMFQSDWQVVHMIREQAEHYKKAGPSARVGFPCQVEPAILWKKLSMVRIMQ